MPYAHQFIPLIRRNAKLPATRTEVFFTMHEEQETVEIKVYQGEDTDALKNVEIGTFLFGDLNQQKGAQEQGILFTYSLDLDGLLKVHAVERATGREIRGVVNNALGHSTEEELSASRKRIEALWGAEEAASVEEAGHAKKSAAVKDTLERAAEALDTAPAEDREEIVNLVEDLRDALQEGCAEKVAACKRELDEILFYLE